MKTFLLVLTAVFTLAACRSNKTEGAAAEDHGDEAAHHDGAQKAGGELSTVRIDPEMLRDLRITTALVESRPGGEGVSVLGEVRVNQDAYAEIGASIPARISRVLVRPGDKVVVGQALIELQSVELGKARVPRSEGARRPAPEDGGTKARSGRRAHHRAG